MQKVFEYLTIILLIAAILCWSLCVGFILDSRFLSIY